MRAAEQADGSVRVTLDQGDSLTIGSGAAARTVTGPATFAEQPIPGLPLHAALAKAGVTIGEIEAAVPAVISDRQFFQQLAVTKDITQDEALAAVQTGALPQKMADAISGLPAAQQFPARMLLTGATAFERAHPMVPVLGAALGKDSAALDALWTAAAQL